MTANHRAVGLLGSLLLVAVAVRLLALDLPGHGGDVRITAGWAERMAEVGPWNFYEGSRSVYPVLLYPLWGLGATLDGEALNGAVKALSIPFDLAIGTLLFALMLRRIGNAGATGTAALYLLNPAVVLAGPVWGQVDSAGALPYLAALLASSAGRNGLAGALGALAVLVKPQFGLVMLPVLAAGALQSRRSRSLRPILCVVGGALAAYVLVAVPLRLDPVLYLRILSDAAQRQPETSLHAFNPWGVLIGFGLPDDRYVMAGALLLLLGVVGSMLGLRHGRDLATLLAVGAVLVLAFYLLPTRVHERYLFAAAAILAPFALSGRLHLAAYVGLSAAFAASLLYALHRTTAFTLPEQVAGPVVSAGGTWVIGIVLAIASATWAWLLIVRRPRLARRRRSRTRA